MRKGKGELTYKQMQDAIRRLTAENKKLRHDLNSLTVAHNKLLKEKQHG